MADLIKIHLKISLVLKQALRPHGKEVTAIHSSPKCDLIATCSSDKTIFLFGFEDDTIRPLGFISLMAKIIDFVFVSQSKIVAWCDDGMVFQITIPKIESLSKFYMLR